MEGSFKGPGVNFSYIKLKAPCYKCEKRTAFCKKECKSFKEYERQKFELYEMKDAQRKINEAISFCDSNRVQSFKKQGGHKFKHGRASDSKG